MNRLESKQDKEDDRNAKGNCTKHNKILGTFFLSRILTENKSGHCVSVASKLYFMFIYRNNDTSKT